MTDTERVAHHLGLPVDEVESTLKELEAKGWVKIKGNKVKAVPLQKIMDGLLKKVYDDAVAAGNLAALQQVARVGERGPVGFAWVIIHPARGPFISWCKRNKIGRKHCHGGWLIDAHGPAQTESVHLAYAEAMAKVFQANDLECYAGSRAD